MSGKLKHRGLTRDAASLGVTLSRLSGVVNGHHQDVQLLARYKALVSAPDYRLYVCRKRGRVGRPQIDRALDRLLQMRIPGERLRVVEIAKFCAVPPQYISELQQSALRKLREGLRKAA